MSTIAAPLLGTEPATGSLLADRVGVTIDGRTILQPTTVAVAPGTTVGIIGHNGSGKSTLLKCLARQMTPTTGRVLIGGRPAETWRTRAFARQLAFLPQQVPAHTGLLGRELVSFGRYPWHGPLGRMGRHGLHAVAEAMRLADVALFADRPVDQLSGGERQRVWIAMLIAQESGFILLDEPIASLDLAHQIEVLGMLRALTRQRNAGVALVLHDINMAARFCGRIVALKAGAVIAEGAPEAILRADVLEAIYGIPMRVIPGERPDEIVAVPR